METDQVGTAAHEAIEDGTGGQIMAALRAMALKKRPPNASPRGPQSVSRGMSQREIRRASGQTNRGADVKLVDEWHFAGAQKGKVTLIASPRAPKRTSGARGKVR